MRAFQIALASLALGAATTWAATAQVVTAAAPAPQPAQIAAPTILIPAQTTVAVELADTLSSRTNHIGDTFGLRLAEPIIVNDQVVASAGAVGGGEVIDAGPSGLGGRPGKLIISARYLEIGGQRVRLHGMQLTALGHDNTNGAIAVGMIPYAGVVSIFIHGGEIEMPAGARGTARTAADLQILTSALVAPAPQTTSETTPATAGAPSPTGENRE